MTSNTSPVLAQETSSSPGSSDLLGSVSQFAPTPPNLSLDKQLEFLQSEINRLAHLREQQAEQERARTEQHRKEFIDTLPAQLGVEDLATVVGIIRTHMSGVGKRNNRKLNADQHDDINRAIIGGASYKEVKKHFGISPAAYYNRKRKLGLTRPVTPLAKRKYTTRQTQKTA